MPTHEVLNQPPPLEGINSAAEDAALLEGVRREGAGWAEERVVAFGAKVAGEPVRWGEQANRNAPVRRTHDRFGNRIDEVDFHPAWHELMRLAVENEVPSLPWRSRAPGAHVARAATFYLLSQVEAGVLCPMAMTFAV